MFTQTEIENLVNRIVACMSPEKVLVFGSYAKGTATIGSDLDIFVIADTALPMACRADDVKPTLSRTLMNVDIHVYTPEEVEELGKEPLSFVSNVLHSAKTVFEKERNTNHEQQNKRQSTENIGEGPG